MIQRKKRSLGKRHLGSENRLSEGKQGFVDGDDIILLLKDMKFDDQIGFAASCQCISGLPDQIPDLIEIQFKCNGQSDTRVLAWVIISIPYFRE